MLASDTPTPKEIGDDQLEYLRSQLIGYRSEDFGDNFHAEIRGEDVTQMIRGTIEWPSGIEGVGDYMQRLHGMDRIEMFDLDHGMKHFQEILRDARMYIADVLFENVVRMMGEKGYSEDDVQRVFSPQIIRKWMTNIDDD